MPQTISGYHSTVQTLSTGQPDVTVTGTINAYGVIGTYIVTFGSTPVAETFESALFGPAAGNFTITNSGVIETHGTNTSNFFGTGVVLGATGSIFNSGTIQGDSGIAIFGSAGTSYIENSNLIEGSLGVGIGLFSESGGEVTVANSGTITGAREAVLLQDGGLLTNALSGVITGVSSYGFDGGESAASTVFNAGTITGYYGGVNLEDGGFISNSGYIHATGTGSTYFYGGILSSYRSTVFNSGTVTGQNGILLQYNSSSASSISIAGYIQNSGLIVATSTLGLTSPNTYSVSRFGIGIELTEPGRVVNAGTITASNAGIFTTAYKSGVADLQNTSSGRITSGKYGVYMQNGGSLNNAGSISGGSDGALLLAGATISNDIGAEISGGVAIWSKENSGGPLNISNAGTLDGFVFGVLATLAPTIVNDGLIEGNLNFFITANGATFGGVGVNLTDGGIVTNQSGGIISGGQIGVALASSEAANGTIVNSGLIEGSTATFVYGPTHQVSSTGLAMVNGGDVTNTTQGTISGNQVGIVTAGAFGATPQINNSGLILGAATLESYFNGSNTYASTGISMLNGGNVNNAPSGTISGFEVGLLALNAPGANVSLDNAGLILGTGTTIISNGTVNGTDGSVIEASGSLTNEATGTISGFGGGLIAVGGAGVTNYITNLGLISATGTTIISNGTVNDAGGIADLAAGTLDNTESGRISGDIGAVLGSYLTFVNAGTLSGGASSLAAYFLGSHDRLVVDPGAVFNGAVITNHNFTWSDSIELAAGAGNGTLSGIGSQFTGFSSFDFDNGATWTLAGDIAGLNATDTINGFAEGDVIDLTSFSAAPGLITITNAAQLVISSGGTLEALNINPSDTGTEIFTLTSDGAGGTDIMLASAPCFCAGTQIRTARGEVPVEALKIGDTVKTLDGRTQKIQWIGTRSYEGRFIAGNHLMLPVRIKAGAIAPNIPARDLFVSPGHAIYVDGALIPAWRLIDGVSITQATSVDQVEYFHIELARHDIILAENCPAESFYDDSCRHQFQNAASYQPPQQTRIAPPLARTESGFLLDAIQRRLAARAGRQAPAATEGALRGFIDQAGPAHITGWAQNSAAPETPVALEIFCAGRRIARILANQYRADLRAAGLGSGCHGFKFLLPPGVTGPIEIHRAADGCALASARSAVTRAA